MSVAFTRKLLMVFLLGMIANAALADSGVISYVNGNCFVMATEKGLTLFERSGGAFPEVGIRVKGTLHDYGYQQIYDLVGNELLVGYVQYWGVDKGAELISFKKECR
ncbi:MAG: hypothetical protein GY938_20870 [Ketobacter sp.]|nr:hypothetical protein [Ketobacter sp.]